MRIRSIRPEFWRSEDIAQHDWWTRLVFIGLWSYVDDNGVGRDVERLIVTDLFPLDEDLSECSVRVHGALKQLETGGQISRYSVDGKPYLHVTAFDRHQVINRKSKARYPLPTSEDATPRVDTHGVLSEPSVSPQATDALGEGEKGRRGEGGEASAIALRDDPRDDVDRLCDHLANLIAANGSKRPTVTQKWRDAARLMLDRDEHTEGQIAAAIDWCQGDDFWRANVMSMPKLREKYDQMRLQAERQRGPVNRRQQETDDMFSRAMARAQAREAATE